MQMPPAHVFRQHVNKAQERPMCPESELGEKYMWNGSFTLLFDGYYPATTIQHNEYY